MTCDVSRPGFTLVEVVVAIETVLCSRLRPWYSSPSLYEYDSETIIRKCIQTKLAMKSNNLPPSRDCLLSVVILSDGMIYGPSFLRVHMSLERDKDYNDLVIMGWLDETLHSLFMCNDIVSTFKAEVMSIFSFCNNRMTRISRDFACLGSDRFFAIILVFLQSALSSESINRNTLKRIMFQCIQQAEARVHKCPLITYDKFFEASLDVCLKSNQDDNGVKELSSAMFVYLCQSLLPLLRMSRVSGNDQDTPSPLLYILWLEQFLSSDIHFDTKYLEQKGVAFLKSLVKSCLRVGIGLDDLLSEDFRLACLKLVMTLMKSMQDGTSTLKVFGALFDPSLASQAFIMVTSHSKFDALMSSNTFLEGQAQILRILFSCLTSNHSLQFNRSIWTSLLSNFQAGVREKDFLIRLVLMEYAKVAERVSVFCC